MSDFSSSKIPNSSDCISRQAAKEAYCKHFCYRGVICPDNLCKEVNEAFDKLPSAQPERRTGKWMLGFDNRYMEKYYYCSCCGGRKYEEYEPSDCFCSNCGADMRG